MYGETPAKYAGFDDTRGPNYPKAWHSATHDVADRRVGLAPIRGEFPRVASHIGGS